MSRAPLARRAHSACTQCEGELGESMWRKLEDEILADRATNAHNLAHLATLARDSEKAAALGKRGTRRTAASTARGRGLRQAEGQGEGDQ